MMRRILKKIIVVFLSKIVIKINGGIWSFKKKIKEMPYGLKKEIYLSIYNKYFEKKGSYIGSRSDLSDIPLFPHGFLGVFISDNTKIGKNCVIFQQVTIGSNNIENSKIFGSPTIGNNVLIGAGSKIIGNIKIGNNCRIGANVAIFKDIQDKCIVLPASEIIIQKNELKTKLLSQKETKYGLNWFYYENGNWIKK